MMQPRIFHVMSKRACSRQSGSVIPRSISFAPSPSLVEQHLIRSELQDLLIQTSLKRTSGGRMGTTVAESIRMSMV